MILLKFFYNLNLFLIFTGYAFASTQYFEDYPGDNTVQIQRALDKPLHQLGECQINDLKEEISDIRNMLNDISSELKKVLAFHNLLNEEDAKY